MGETETERVVTAHLVQQVFDSCEIDLEPKRVRKSPGKCGPNKHYFSHFDLYILAMKDIGADSSKIIKFIKNFNKNEEVCQKVPKESLEFIKNTFNCIDTNKLSNIAAIFTYGRETTIPDMFSRILDKIDEKDHKLKNLRLYIKRHIEVDSSRHGPLSIELFNYTCNQNQDIYDEAINYAVKAIDSRIKLWDGVLKKLS